MKRSEQTETWVFFFPNKEHFIIHSHQRFYSNTVASAVDQSFRKAESRQTLQLYVKTLQLHMFVQLMSKFTLILCCF